MAAECAIIQCPESVETAELHFKATPNLKIFDCDRKSFDGNVSLLAVSQHYGLTFVGTFNGFAVLKTKDIFSATNPSEYRRKDVILNCRPTHIAVDYEQRHLAVGCNSKFGAIIYIYDISTLTAKEVSPIKTIPLPKPSQSFVTQISDLMWQPNGDSALTVCLSDGSVASLNLLRGTGNEIFSLPNTTQARCLCWSPKGKQIVFGCSDGSLSQYKPDLKFVKKLNAPPLFNGNVSVVNILWVSSFQFVVAYNDSSKPQEFPIIMIVNTPKNEPISFINYEDITYSSTFYRGHQLYLFHQSAWNLIYVASANSIEIAVLHGRDNSVWEQWFLGDASRAELPLNDERGETFPVGFAIDNTSERAIPWGEESLPPMPRLILLSNEGLLTTFNIVNISPNSPQLCSPPKENVMETYFTPANVAAIPSNAGEKEVPPESTSMNQKEDVKSLSNFGFLSSFSPLSSTPLSTPVKIQPAKEEVIPFIQQQTSVNPPVQHRPVVPALQQQQQQQQQQAVIPAVQQQPVIPAVQQQPFALQQSAFQFGKANFLSTSNNTTNEQSKPLFAFASQESKPVSMENQNPAAGKGGDSWNGYGAKPPTTVGTESPAPNLGAHLAQNKAEASDAAKAASPEKSSFPLSAPAQGKAAVPSQAPVKAAAAYANPPATSPAQCTSELAAVDDSVYLTALQEEIEHFDSELKGIISRVSASDIQIGTDDEKLHIRKSIKKLNEFRQELNETTATQKTDIYSLKIDTIEAFAWLEDAKSRNRQRKNATFVQLKKLEKLDSISSGLMKEITHLRYYIESQLKQLYLHLDKEWMEHEDKRRLSVKNTMAVPSTEDLYKALHLQLTILNKMRLSVEELRGKVTERNCKIKSKSSLYHNSADNDKSRRSDSKTTELSILADNLLKIKIDREEHSQGIYPTDAIQLMIKNQLNSIAERSKKFTVDKQNVLRDVLGERQTVKTRSVKPAVGNSTFIRSILSRLTSQKRDVTKDSETSSGGTESSPSEGSSAQSVSRANVRAYDGVARVSSSHLSDEKKENVKEAESAKSSNSTGPCPTRTNEELTKQPLPFSSAPTTSAGKDNVKTPDVFTFSVAKTTGATFPNKQEACKAGNNGQKSTPFVFKASPNATAALAFGSVTKPAISTSPLSNVASPTASFAGDLTEKSTNNSSSSTNLNLKLFPQQGSPTPLHFSTPGIALSSAPSTNPVFSPKTQTNSLTSASAPIFGAPGQALSTSRAVTSEGKLAATPSNASIFSFSSRINDVAKSTGSTPVSGSIFGGTPAFSFSTLAQLPKNTSSSDSVTVTPVAVGFSSKGGGTSPDNASDNANAGVSLSKATVPASKTWHDGKSESSGGATIDLTPTVAERKQEGTPVAEAAPNNGSTLISTTVGNVGSVGAQHLKEDQKDEGGKETEESSRGEVKEEVSDVAPGSEPVPAVEERDGEKKTSPEQSMNVGSASDSAAAGVPPAATAGIFATNASPVVAASGVFNLPKSDSATSPVSHSSEIVFGKTITAAPVAAANIFAVTCSGAPSATQTDSSSLFKTPAATSSANIFGQKSSTTVTSSGIFGQVTPAATTASTFGQAKKDEVGATTDLFGQMLGSNLASGSVFGTPSTNASGNIFGKSAFDSSGGSIFGNSGAPATTTVTTASVFGTNSSNIFSRLSTSFGQITTSSSASVFGQPQVSGSGGSFFGQSICTSFSNPTTAAPNQNPFAVSSTSTAFNSKSGFGQNLFGQNTGSGGGSSGTAVKNPFGRSSVFGATPATTSSGGSIFQSGSTSFECPPGPFSHGQTTTGQSGFGASPAFQKSLGGFGGSPVFGSGLGTTAAFGAPPTFGGAPTFGTPASFGNPQKVFGSPQGTFGQSQTQASNFESLANQGTDGFASLAQQSQSPAFGGSTMTSAPNFGSDATFGRNSFSAWRSGNTSKLQIGD